MELNQDKLNELLGKVVNEMGAGANAPLVLLGDKLGLYEKLSEGGAMTSQALADATGTAERYVRVYGPGLPKLDLLRLRLPRQIHRGSPRESQGCRAD